MAVLKLSSPWVIYYREIEAMFKNDPLVHVIFDEEAYHIKIYVDEAEKAAALSAILKEEKTFGNVTLKISVLPPNNETFDEEFNSLAELYEAAFDTNPAFSFCQEVLMPFGNTMTYVVFNKEVVQYFTDNLADYYGVYSTLYQVIAKDVFNEADGTYYCTDINDKSVLLKAEWP